MNSNITTATALPPAVLSPVGLRTHCEWPRCRRDAKRRYEFAPSHLQPSGLRTRLGQALA
jgi:hypothetical protein